MNEKLIIVMAQCDFLLGDIEGNAAKIIATAKQAREQLAGDIVVFPELALTGYPPEDLLLRQELHQRVEQALQAIAQQNTDIHLLLGHPLAKNGKIYNAASVFYKGNTVAQYFKQHLPNYSVFDEKRYFTAGNSACLLTVKNCTMAITICEDLWQSGPMQQAVSAGAQLMLSINASPFHWQKHDERIKILQQRQCSEGAIPIIYVNCVGGQDELVFDGGSVVLDETGCVTHKLESFAETLQAVVINVNETLSISPGKIHAAMSDEQTIYQALVLGTRDYVQKNNFHGALIGLSGGIDSALTLAIAVDALGSENVHAVSMPSRFTATMSNEDAALQAKNLNVKYSVIPIETCHQAFLDSLQNEFSGLASDTTEENIQARCRGVLLMALSNKTGKIVLTTGNKSEMAVGYATLYGDMAGGFAVLKDVPKTLVYRLAKYRNSISPCIPERVIERAPSAELADDQKDQDSLPPYDILDEVLQRYVEHDQSIEDMIADGLDEKAVRKVVSLIDRNEYKRRQAAPGIKISNRAFGRDWRYPITSGFGRKDK